MLCTWRQIGLGTFVMTAGALMTGCGSNAYEMAHVTGTVTCNGKPAIGGFVIFEPLDAPDKTGRPEGNPGRPSRALVGEDGRFTLVYDPGAGSKEVTGAVTGPHKVTFIQPQTTPAKWNPQDDWLPDEEKEKLKAELAARPVYEPLECGSVITPAQVDVQPGTNEFSFTLEAGSPAAKPSFSQPSGSD